MRKRRKGIRSNTDVLAEAQERNTQQYRRASSAAKAQSRHLEIPCRMRKTHRARRPRGRQLLSAAPTIILPPLRSCVPPFFYRTTSPVRAFWQCTFCKNVLRRQLHFRQQRSNPTVRPNAPQTAKKASILTPTAPISSLSSVRLDTPARCANSACVRFRLSRICASRLPDSRNASSSVIAILYFIIILFWRIDNPFSVQFVTSDILNHFFARNASGNRLVAKLSVNDI